MKDDGLFLRMKEYEHAASTRLPRRLPVIIRLDGKAFHTYTRGCQRPYDVKLREVMVETTKELCKQIQGVQMAYTQSDEISLLVHNYKTRESQPWFDNQVQKMASVSASIASATFTANSWKIWSRAVGVPALAATIKPAYFDARVFVLPESEVCNYFIWRQKDATTNSLQMLAQSLFSPKQLHGKKFDDLLHMCKEKGHDWSAFDHHTRMGVVVEKSKQARPDGKGGTVFRSAWQPVGETPNFIDDRSSIDRHLAVDPCDECGEKHP